MRTLLAVISLSSVLAAPAAAEPVRVSYDKGVVLETEDGAYRLKLALRNQFRFESTRPTGDGAEFASRVYIPRSRLQLEGHVFAPDTRYKVEVSLGDRGNFGYLRDVYVDQRLAGSPVWLRFGQWKRPFNRQELVSDFASELNERAITAEFVGGGRDLGVAVHNDYEKSPDGLEWAAGVFNGFSGGSDRPGLATTCTEDPATMELECVTPPPSTFPGDFGPAVVARVGWNHGGIKGYSEGDLEGGPLRLAIGAGYKVDLADLAGADELSHGVQADAMLKVAGFDLQLGLYLMKLAGADARAGALVQAGYFVIPARAQVAARFAVAPTTGTREQLEARAAFDWYWQGHAWKLVSDAGVLQETGDDPMTGLGADPVLQVRVMAQLTL